jgi:hypothetical protein
MKIKHTLKNETMKLSHFNEKHVKCWKSKTFIVHDECWLLKLEREYLPTAEGCGNFLLNRRTDYYVGGLDSISRAWIRMKKASSYSSSESNWISPGTIIIVPPWPHSVKCRTNSSISAIIHTLSESTGNVLPSHPLCLGSDIFYNSFV